MAKGWAITKPSFLKSKGGNSSGPLLKLLLSLLMAASTLFTVNETAQKACNSCAENAVTPQIRY